MQWSRYQQAIFEEAARHTIEDCAVVARAGSGKSTSLVESLNHVPYRRVLLCAFNKSIQVELERRAPRHVQTRTLHSLGLRVHQLNLQATTGQPAEVEPNKAREQSLALMKESPTYWRRSAYEDPKRMYEIAAIVRKTASYAKNVLATTPEELLDIASLQDVDSREEAVKVAAAARALLKRSADDPHRVDFDDMVWMPWHFQYGVADETEMLRFDAVLVDECLPHYMPVLLADGRSLPIGEIVEKKLSVEVLGYDTQTGRQVPCRVTNWVKLPNQKPLVKVKVRWSQKRKKNGNIPTNFVICTADHRIWTRNGWVEAGKLAVGDVVQVETSAHKTQLGKITTTGRTRLSTDMTKKNACMPHKTSGGISIRGGNGRDMTVPQRHLLEALMETGPEWQAEVAVPTGRERSSGYPSCYKIDIANPYDRIAMQDTQAIVCTLTGECPIDAVVVSVEAVATKDWFVYDISVERCHNFYANGILVHNCQDLNAAQHWLISKMRRGGRVLSLLDPKQCIYGFRGADRQTVEAILADPNTQKLSLPISYRCPVSVIEKARTIVPDIEPMPDARDGSVTTHGYDEMCDTAEPGDFILSRTNAPLMTTCLRLLRRSVPATIAGRDIGQGLSKLIDKSKARSVSTLTSWLHDWLAKEHERHMPEHPERYESARDRAACLFAITPGMSTTQELQRKIAEMFSDEDDASRVVCSTVHRAKGLERDRVWMLSDTFGYPVPKPWQDRWSEENVWYVAVTRAKDRLCFVDTPMSEMMPSRGGSARSRPARTRNVKWRS